MWRHSARLSEKTSDAQLPEDSGDLGDRRERLLAAARMRFDRDRAEDLSLRLIERRRSRAAPTPAGAGQLAAAVRLSTPPDPAAAGRPEDQPQEAVPPVPRRAAIRTSSGRPQASSGHAVADDIASGAQPALESRLCL